MHQGIDYKFSLTPYIYAIQEDGYDFVCRYYNLNDPAKNLTREEAQALSDAGLAIVAVWENGIANAEAGTSFNYIQGIFDGAIAFQYAYATIGQPLQTPIYFSVDYDYSALEISNYIIPYFIGIQAAFNTYAGDIGNQAYPIGVYGSGLVCYMLLKANIVTYTWVTQSSGWRGTSTFADYSIKQLLPTLLKGTSLYVDPDVSPDGDEGSFTLNNG